MAWVSEETQMKKTTGLIIGEIIWAAVCFFGWAQALFFGFPKGAGDLKMYAPTEYAISQILCYAIPVIWLIIAVVIVVKCKRK